MTHSDSFAAFQARRDAERTTAKQKRNTNRQPSVKRTRTTPNPETPVVTDPVALQKAQESALLAGQQMQDARIRFAAGAINYDQLAEFARAYSGALYEYEKLKCPARARRVPYHNLIR